MADQDHQRNPRNSPPDPDHMRDAEYLVRGYRATLSSQGLSHADRVDALSDDRLTVWLEDISDEHRQRARMRLDGQPYDPAATRSANESNDGKKGISREGG